MKSKITLLVSAFITLSSLAQNGINYKALIKDDIGNIVANQSVQVQLSILKGVGSTNVYSESHTPTTDSFGVMSITIGEGSLISGDFPSIDWGNDDHFLNVQIDTGSGLVDMGTTEFKSVPYALYAANIGLEKLNEGDGNGWRLAGRDANNYGVIGLGATDLSFSNTIGNTTNGATGQYSFATGYQTIASGSQSFAVGEGSTASGFNAMALGKFNVASGFNSSSLGEDNVASAQGSMAFGIDNQSTAYASTAMGNLTIASGNISTAFGLGSKASGKYSTAFGTYTKAEAMYTTAMGKNNIGGGTPEAWVETDPIFEIGNTLDVDFPSNALTILKNGTITAPSFDISEITDARALITKEYADANYSGGGGGGSSSGLEAIDEGNGTGWRLIGRDPANYEPIGENAIDFSDMPFPDPGKGASGNGSVAFGIFNIASGDFSFTQGVDSEASGQYAFALGNGTIASGTATFAMGGPGTEASGPYATAFGLNSVASGNYASAMGYNNTAVGWNSFAAGVGNNAIGTQSMAVGGGNEASGHSAVALGNVTVASGQNSTAMGTSTIASAPYANAFGFNSEATGNGSTAFGSYTKADALEVTVIGKYNIGGGTPSSWVETEPLFEIGNGISDASRNNALTVLKNGTVLAPSFDLAEITDPKALITKEYADALSGGGGASGLEALDEGNGNGWRLIGADPANYGNLGSNATDLSINATASTTKGATGQGSHATGIGTEASGASASAMGFLTEASGDYSVALGSLSQASGLISTAMGFNAVASGQGSVAAGYNVTASEDHAVALGKDTNAGALNATAFGNATLADGNFATAMGSGTIASGIASTAMGNLSAATGLYATAMGTSTQALGNFSTALGVGTTAQGQYSLSTGYNTTALGTYSSTFGQLTTTNAENSVAMGIGTIAENMNSLVIGEYNDPGSQTEVLFQIGNGTGNGVDPGTFRANSMTVYRSGNVTIAGSLTQTSDKRLKENIVELEYGLKDLLKLDPVAYTWKKFPDRTDRSLGLIAQDVQSVIEEVVHVNKDKDQTLSVSYIELIPVLINAIKELKSENDDLRSTIDKKETAMYLLSERVKNIEQLLKIGSQ